MPLLKAPAYDVDVLATQGHADAVMVRRRNNPAGIPYTGNLILSDPSIVGYCRDIAECLGLDALHDMDLMTDDHGKPCLLEVNPRPSGSVVAAHAAGYPIVAAAIAQKLGRDYPLVPPRRDIEVIVMPRAVALA
jgi:predicted ATP-grasp superfamily ATP-dependent carboligase